ncbi:CUB domain protein [Trichuris suis]|nr:CUB domain protein [Trichuris suis]
MSGTDSLNATYGYIASPNFPGPYEPDNKLSWEMASSDTQNGQVRITIVALNLAYNAETRTCLDYIEIYDRNTRRYKCPVTHAGVFCDISAECGGIIEAEQLGKVQSPYYPVGYTPGSICRWIISAPFDHIVYFELVKVFLDNPAECKDFITVSQSSPLMTQVAITKRYCGDKVTGRMQSEFDTLDIKLTCNSGLSFPGFVLTYEIAPNFCLSNPCNDNQICTNNHEWFVCTCKPGYTGSNCEDSKLVAVT